MRAPTPPVRDLVLLGGGHSHVQVLKAFGMRPLPGVRLSVISREVHTPYSGMLPGQVAGLYDWRATHIDLGPLARFAGARLLADEAVGLDLAAGRIELAEHPAVRFDLLSINTGAVPEAPRGIGVPVKPIGRFLPRWHALQASVRPGQRIGLVGGGAGGVELALAMRRALPADVALVLVSDRLLPGFGASATRRLRRALDRADVELVLDANVQQACGRRLTTDDGRAIELDHLFWVTGVTAPEWLGAAGLDVDAQGFVRVDAHLRSVSHGNVFAAGDVAALQGQPRPKSGVFAVREGPVLADNLRRALLERPLRRYRAQRRFLSILGTADGRAVASRGRLCVEGRWVWRWKDRIDRRFMARFKDLPEMLAPTPDVPDHWRADSPEPMRCGGCGAKLGADPLRRVLARLPPQGGAHVRLGIGDDAALLTLGGPGELLLTVDGFRSVIDDAYRFGRIAAHHSLNDVIAMGGRGIAALALATVPLMAEAMMEEELYQLLRGAVDVLNAHGVPLVGGHSAEGLESSLALTITGVIDGAALTKAGLRPGDALILTKPIGTGVLLAASMRGRVPSDELAVALASMDQSNAPALEVLRGHGVSALTDVTGFGLVGHLGEMLRASRCGAHLDARRVPRFAGAERLVAAGVISSLQRNNEAALADFMLPEGGRRSASPLIRLLADPQTSGGLLAGVPAEGAAACLAALQDAGYPHAARVGTVTADERRVESS